MGNACPHRSSEQERLRRVTEGEVKENGWLIILGKVYNVKEYMSKHPGGQDILLGVMGKDATVEFETMRHSELALKQLEQLLVGSYDTSAPAQRKTENLRDLPLTGGRAGTAQSWWDVQGRGFLPGSDPVKELPMPWDQLTRLAEVLPSFAVQGKFRQLCGELRLPCRRQDVSTAIEALSAGELECLHSLLGYVCLSYIHSPPEIYEDSSIENIMVPLLPKTLLPNFLSIPWLCVSERLERRPMLDYAGCVLNNWERLDPQRPLVPSNVRLLRRFTGLVDEEWFFKTHIIIEAEGSHVVSSLESINRAVKQKDELILLQELRSLEENLWRLSSVCLPIMFARSPRDHTLLCEPFLFFFRLRNYIKSVDVSMADDDATQQLHLHGPSGAMSSILPAVDALLGIRNTSAELREAVKKFEDYVPKEHRAFLDQLRNSDSVKVFIETRRETIDENTWFALAAAFNSCISRVLDFRWRHWSFVEQFIVRPSSSKSTPSACPVAERGPVGTGGTHFDYLQQHITDSQRARIPLSSAEALMTPEAKVLRPVEVPPAPLDVSLWDIAANGFVTNRAARLPGWGPFGQAPSAAGRALLELVGLIPTFCYTYPGLEHTEDLGVTHPFLLRCDQRRGELTELLSETDMEVQELEHVWLLLVFVASALRTCSGPCRAESREAAFKALPTWLVPIMVHFEQLVGREWHGTPEYCELVLNNWVGYELQEDFVVSRDTAQLVQPVARFMATPDEEWYRKLHLVLEAEGGRAIARAHMAFPPAMSARDTGAVIVALNSLASDMDSLSDFQMRQFDGKDSRGEVVMMQRLRPFVAEDQSEEDYAVWVYREGSSPLLPALHAILGLRKLDGISGPLQEHWHMGRHRMPQEHRQFLDCLERGTSVRAYCLCAWRQASVEKIAAMEDAFNNCIEALLRYCSLRQRLVSRMFPNVSRIRRLSAEQEQVIRSGRLALLQMRRLADSQRMLLSR